MENIKLDEFDCLAALYADQIEDDTEYKMHGYCLVINPAMGELTVMIADVKAISDAEEEDEDEKGEEVWVKTRILPWRTPPVNRAMNGRDFNPIAKGVELTGEAKEKGRIHIEN